MKDKTGSSLQTGLSHSKQFDRNETTPPSGDKTHRPTDNGYIDKKDGYTKTKSGR